MKFTGRKGWTCSTKAAWHLNHTLSPIILAGLQSFKKMERSGVSSKVLKELEEKGIIKSPDENLTYSDADLEKASIEWEIMLDKMIYAFNIDNQPKNSDYEYKIEMVEKEKTENSTTMDFNVTGQEELERFKKESEKHKELSEEGFKLFGQYFSALWD